MGLYEKYFKKMDTIIYEVPRTVVDSTLSEAMSSPRELRTVKGKIMKEDKEYTFVRLPVAAQNARVGTYLVIPSPLIRKIIRP